MKLSSIIIGHILRFIRARHLSDMQESTKQQKWLKKRLGKDYTRVLLQNGDPDRDGYMEVMMKWFEEEAKQLKQG